MAIGYYYDSDIIHKVAKNALAMVIMGLSKQSDARVYLSTVESNGGKAPEYEGKLDSLVGDVETFAFLQDGGLVQEQLEEEGQGEDNPIPEENMARPCLPV